MASIVPPAASAHFVPLAPMARDVLSSVPRLAGCTYVFSTNGRTAVSGWSKVKRRLDALMEEELGHARVKANRRHFRFGMAETGSIFYGDRFSWRPSACGALPFLEFDHVDFSRC